MGHALGVGAQRYCAFHLWSSSAAFLSFCLSHVINCLSTHTDAGFDIGHDKDGTWNLDLDTSHRRLPTYHGDDIILSYSNSSTILQV